MADKRIADFATLEEAQDDDLLLVSSEGETYNMKFGTFKTAVQGDADRAAAAAEAAKAAAQLATGVSDEALKAAEAAEAKAQDAKTKATQATHKRQHSPRTLRRNPPHALSRRFWTRRKPSHPSMSSPKISTT